MILYHVDRTNSFKEGQEVTLTKDFPGYLNSFRSTILKLYPDGLSNHGLRYSTYPFNSNYPIETAFELNRKLYFPDKISRFQSFFCFQTLAEAKNFAKNYPDETSDYKIYEVEVDHDNYFIGDMSLVRSSTVITSYIDSHDYWSGNKSCHPIFEVLVKPPLKIHRMVYSE